MASRFIDFEAGFTVELDCDWREPPADDGPAIERLALPAGPAVTALHWGPYGDLPFAHQAAAKFIRERGLTPSDHAYEIYWVDRSHTEVEAELRTEVVYPVAESAVE